MRRRAFLGVLGGVAAWPRAARAQQPSMPVIGFLHPTSPDANADRLRGFHLGLKEAGYVEGENVAIVYRWAEARYERLPEVASELVRRQVTVIAATGGSPAALAAKAATTTIPIVFAIGEDPVGLGLVTSLARPGGNATGINYFTYELVAKRLELLRVLMPGMARLAVLVNPTNVTNTEATLRDVDTSARAIGLQIQVLKASTIGQISAAFATLARERVDALFVGPDALFNSRRVQIAILAARHVVPATYPQRGFVEAGGLMSYGTNLAHAWRQAGVYIGRILKGANPTDLPVMQASKFELVINAQTAMTLGLTVPPSLLAIADELIE